jgi:hypothetical protein
MCLSLKVIQESFCGISPIVRKKKEEEEEEIDFTVENQI